MRSPAFPKLALISVATAAPDKNCPKFSAVIRNDVLPHKRLYSGVAGAVLAFALTSSTLSSVLPLPTSTVAEAVSPPTQETRAEVASPDARTPGFSPSQLSAQEKKQLKDQSKRNTRAAGRVSQQFSLARKQEAAGELSAALATYNEIVKADPDFAPAYSNRGNIYATRRNFAAALSDYDRSLALAPLAGDSWVVYVNRGCTKLAEGDDPYDALADMNIAYELRGDNEVVLSNRAGVYEVLGKYDNAIRDYQRALKSSDVQPFWNRYGLILFQRNKPTEAIAILKRVAARFDVSDVHAAMAVIYFDRGETAKAETEWSQVDRPRLFESKAFLEGERKWPPRAIEAMENFRHLKQ